MPLQAIIRSQFQAALAMLKQAIAACPDAMWDDARDRGRFWQVAYHTLFYTHRYLAETDEAFRPWERHVAPAHRLEEAFPSALYTRADLLDYLAVCRQQVDEQTPRLDPEAPSGFEWLPFSKLELQLYNLRHLQQHTGELAERLGARAQIELEWVDVGRD